uniref:Ig-like domain-containing protein n=1 Tax=Panthera leo TaxID=9689 RepID=A0A8C8X4F0_PANLE
KDYVEFPCQYNIPDKNFESVYWYLQRADQRFTYIGHTSQGTVELEHYQLFVNRKLLSSTLTIKHVQPRDKAIYYCAVRHCGNNYGQGLIFGQGTSLSVLPSIQNPDPAVYQLKSPESSNISVCLFTDFDSEINVEPSTESNMTRLKSTSLDMKTMDSKSNGALAWSNSFDLGCNSTFNYTFHSSSEFPCDANVVEKGFETDMNLNFYNLLVIVLRITFLKVVGFNLLMTLRLWSS